MVAIVRAIAVVSSAAIIAAPVLIGAYMVLESCFKARSNKEESAR